MAQNSEIQETWIEALKRHLHERGHEVIDQKPIQSGTQLHCKRGQKVNLYTSGKITLQGKNTEEIKDLPNNIFELLGADRAAGASRKIFVVYGHDHEARTQLENMLRRWGLEPLCLDQLPSQGQTIIEKLETYTDQARFAVVLATPDDEGYRRGHMDEKKFRARQNVVLELGMMLVKLGRRRVAILIKDPETMERPSDIQGLIYIPFKDNVEDAKVQLAKEMNSQGFHIDLEKL